MQQLKNWSATNFTSEERLIEAPEDMYIAVVDGYLENKASETNTITFSVYTHEDQKKFSIDYTISEGRKRNLTTKVFLQNREYLSIETSDGEADVVLFGSEAPVSELDPPEGWSWMGEWDSSVTYHPNNLVRAKDGSVYKAKETTQGDVPYEDNDKWELFTENIGTWQGFWDSDLTYYPNDVVRADDNNLYIATSENSDENPESSSDSWELFLEAFGDYRGSWESDKTYYSNDIVLASDNNLYMAKEQNSDIDPTEDSEDHWQLFLEGFGSWQGDWDESYDYDINDIVRGTDGNVYIAVESNINSEPSSSSSDWDLFLERSDINANQIQGINITTDSPEDRQVLVYDSSNDEFVYESNGVSWSVYTSTKTIDSMTGVIADTSDGGFTINLPESPSVGDIVAFMDYNNNWSNDDLNVYGNGNTIEGDDNFYADVDGGSFYLIWNDDEWKLRFE